MTFQIGSRVNTRVGSHHLEGTIVSINDSRSEHLYEVSYDVGGFGAHTADELHLASMDYPELGNILFEEPSAERKLLAFYKTASRDPFAITLHAALDQGVETGDSLSHPDPLGAAHNVDLGLASYPEGTKCALCNLRPIRVEVDHTPLCGWCAQNRYGFPIGNEEPQLFGQMTAQLHTASWDSDQDNLYAQTGCHHTSLGRSLASHHLAKQGDPGWEEYWHTTPHGLSVPHWAREGANSYRSQIGLPAQSTDYSHMMADKDRGKRIAREYDAAPNHDPSAHQSYDALAKEINHQYEHMTRRMGVKVEYTNEDPYPDFETMRHDVINNKRLKILRTSATGPHPYLSDESNDRFRAVHDMFGHVASGRNFDRHGEEAAWHHHTSMFTPLARGALTSETRGQNSSLIYNGEFPPQKVALLSPDLWSPDSDTLHTSALDTSAVAVAGLAVIARDTNRVLLIQRSMSHTDPAAGKWEFPGGHLEDNESPIEGAIREWKEEVGSHLPSGTMGPSWVSKKIYLGTIYVIPRESDLPLNLGDAKPIVNPDSDPDQDGHEVVAWFDPKDLSSNPAVRKELREGTDWSLFKPKSIEKIASQDKTSKWVDVQAKAKQLRQEGRVHITETPTKASPYLAGDIEGEHGTYYAIIHRDGNKILNHSCSCPWGSYSEMGPNADQRAPGSPYKRRVCSHELALWYDFQSRAMGIDPIIGALHLADDDQPELPLVHHNLPYLVNPHDQSTFWHHGTPKKFYHFRDPFPESDGPDYDESFNEEPRYHWNAHLGTHWTSIRDVANHFARGDYSGTRNDATGDVITAQLHIKKPKHYVSEYDMDDAALVHAHRHGFDEHIDEYDRPSAIAAGVLASSGTILTHHPDVEDIADDFKRHLMKQGYDGITYGNEEEGPTRHICAIAFDPDQVHHMRRRNWRNASMQTYTAGYLDGVTQGNPSEMVKRLDGTDLADYYRGFREGVKSFYKPEMFTPHLSHTSSEDFSLKAPGVIDAELAHHHVERARHIMQLNNAMDSLHIIVGDKKKYYTKSKWHWEKGHKEVLDRPSYLSMRGGDQWERAHANYKSSSQKVDEETDAINHREEEFNRRGGWSRFFIVPDGHIHSSMKCHSCRPTTKFGWLPELSGKSEEEAVNQHGPFLCSHCFPSAPVEWKRNPTEVKAEDKNKSGAMCAGGSVSHWLDRDEQTERKANHPKGSLNLGSGEGYYAGQRRGSIGHCPTCHTVQKVKNNGDFYQHNSPSSLDKISLHLSHNSQDFSRIAPHYYAEGTPNMNATDWPKLPIALRGRIKQRVLENSPDPKKPLTHERMIRHGTELYRGFRDSDPQALEGGMHWYSHANEQAHQMAHEHGLILPQSTGMIAAISPQTEWEENLAIAHYVAHHLSDPDNKLRLSPEHVEAAFKTSQNNANPQGFRVTPGKPFSEMSHLEAAYSLRAQAKHTDDLRSNRLTANGEPRKMTWTSVVGNLAKAIHIYRGGDVNQILQGHKVRSFHNNILLPHSPHDVTVDSHMVSAISHAKIAAASNKMKMLFDSAPSSKSDNTHGTYALYAAALRRGHHRLVESGDMPEGSVPSQYQAGLWLGWRNLTEGRKTNHPYPIFSRESKLAARSEDELERLDPMREEDIPDPDIFPDEHESEVIRRYLEEEEAERAARVARPIDPHVAGYIPFPMTWHHHLAKDENEWGWEALLHLEPQGALPTTDGSIEDQTEHNEGKVGDPELSPWWQQQHSTMADNPADSGPANFGAPLDPDSYAPAMGNSLPDEELLAPGPALSSSTLAPMWGFDALASLSVLSPLAPRTAALASPPASWPISPLSGRRGVQKVAALSAREQEELIHEGDDDHEVAANFNLLHLEGTHYALLEEELQKMMEQGRIQ